ncbi:activator of Hsp90 ATPase 1-like family protein [Asticcacaulis biprosthecium C19]|uniref:Activator of Hsp90 ATPase 1-like family protein n=1 Tax=Asticcacaulis biprosthecium C19 TaxID=715226 RepID=F4QJ96_9CAUL|nr:SRPBCC family protein [Asticcacaulis biprosthecium]EGF91927.1 activator of Hsp90 ATPase 1-like family protein [Asticcacaulis biprosthecium C19]
MTETPDAIIKTTTLKASLDRVWNAIANADEFGVWFGVRFEGPLVLGEKLKGVIAATQVNDEIAAAQKPWEGTPFEIVVETIEPRTRFAFRWHPYAADKDYDYSRDPMTLVTFDLIEVEGGVHLTITESGFRQLPQHRRGEAFTMNEGGWTAQAGLIEAYLAR